jgi:Amt family ammonium transporter
MTFAGITVALVLGSIVDRMKFSSWVVFTILWLTFIYSPVAHWAWGGGWMGEMGALDFAGGTVVHINAGVAGLVAITPAAGFVNMPASLVIGLFAGILGYVSVSKLKNMLGYDDSLDAFGVHGLCGIWGALATGIFANPAVTEGARGLFYGNPGQLWVQFLSIIGTAAFSAVGTLIVAYLTKLITGGLRVDPEEEIAGLDNAQHGERAFEIQNI